MIAASPKRCVPYPGFSLDVCSVDASTCSFMIGALACVALTL